MNPCVPHQPNSTITGILPMLFYIPAPYFIEYFKANLTYSYFRMSIDFKFF